MTDRGPRRLAEVIRGRESELDGARAILLAVLGEGSEGPQRADALRLHGEIRYQELSAAAPRELALHLLMQLAPTAPFIPEVWHGRPIVTVVASHTGEAEDAERALAPLRALRTSADDHRGDRRVPGRSSRRE